MPLTPLDLSAGFEPVSRSDWEALAEAGLRGRTVDSLQSVRGGRTIEPLYLAGDVSAVETSAVPVDIDRIERGWDVRQRHDGSQAASANAAILEDLVRGVTSIEIGNVAALDLAAVLEGVRLDIAPVALAPHGDVALALALADHIDSAEEPGRSWFGLDLDRFDPYGAPAALEQVLSRAASGTAVVTVDGVRFVEAGATPAQAVGWSWAAAVAVLRTFESLGVDVADASPRIGFRLGASADQFATIASLRAFRSGWAAILSECGVATPAPASVQAVTARSMFSRHAPEVNWLRSTTATLGAVVGGADAVTVLPHDDAIAEPDDFSRRVARNVQLVLLEESHLARLVDPAAGSWFVESLTTDMADAAWAELQAVESAGGWPTFLGDGSAARAAQQAWEVRASGLADRSLPLTGVSQFADLEEARVVAGPNRTADDDHSFPLRRDAAEFEALRARAEAPTQRPFVHVAALGSLAEHGTRSQWVANLLAAGGIETRGGDESGALSPLEAAARFADSGASIAVIASTDAVYIERAVATATALRDAGARHVALAGTGGDNAGGLREAGVDAFWHVGVDVVEVLSSLLDLLVGEGGGS